MNEDIIEQENESQVEAVEEPQEQVEEVEVQPEEQKVEQQEKPDFEYNDPEENIRRLRDSKRRAKERAEQAEYERDQLVKYFESMQNQMGGQQKQYDDLGVKEDEYVEGKHLGKISKSVKELKDELQQWKSYSEEMTAELKLNSEFSDFNEVVTADNVKEFVKKYPEMRSSIQNNDPLYNRGKATYRLIKKFMGEEINTPTNRAKQAKIKGNASQPMPSTSIKEKPTSPLAQASMYADGYTEEIGRRLEKEMYDAISKY